MTVCRVKCILDLGEQFLSCSVIHSAVAVMDKNVIFKDAWVEVDRITRTGSVMLLSLLVGGQGPEHLHRVGVGAGDDEDAAKTVFQIFMIYNW